MLYLSIAFAIVACCTDEFEQTWDSYDDLGHHFAVTISESALKKSPCWEKDAENPPLSAKKAIKLAGPLKDSLVKDSDRYRWELESASLVPTTIAGKWYWKIRYEAQLLRGGSSGEPPNLVLAVLMDGTVVKPDVR